MEYAIHLLALFIALNFLLKVGFYPRWGMWTVAAGYAFFAWLVTPWMTEQSKTVVAAFFASRPQMLNLSVCVTLEAAVMITFCFDCFAEMRTRNTAFKQAVLRCKETWLVAVTTGMFQICSLGVVSQMVLRNMELGFSREQATFILSLVALIGLVGSFFVGYMDERLGTKKSMLFFGIWYALSLLANATENTVLVYVSIFMIGMSIGGSANFTTSLTTSVFGRQGFSKVNSVVFPIQGAVSALSFVVNGVVSNITGGNLRYTYLIFAGVSVVSALIVLLVDEHRFNKDWQQGQNARSAS